MEGGIRKILTENVQLYQDFRENNTEALVISKSLKFP